MELGMVMNSCLGPDVVMVLGGSKSHPNLYDSVVTWFLDNNMASSVGLDPTNINVDPGCSGPNGPSHALLEAA